MLISSSLTVGQITLILRMSIQILAYAGLFLLTMIILGKAPRIASIPTHDLLNRIVGKGTATTYSLKWIVSSLRGQNRDPIKSTRLLIAIFLFTIYSLLVALADLGFLGFHTCSAPLARTLERPLSVGDRTSALALVTGVLTNGTTPGRVNAFRCDATEPDRDTRFASCKHWMTSTFADPALFEGVNMTDSVSLTPRFVSPLTTTGNEYTVGVGANRVVNTTVVRGMAVQPHATGVTAVFGVPELHSEQKVTIPKTLALEGEMGCINLGMYAEHNLDVDSTDGLEVFDTQWKQEFLGPEYMRPVLARYGERLRLHYRGHFNESNDRLPYSNKMLEPQSATASVTSLNYAHIGNNPPIPEDSFYFFGNCTADLLKESGVLYNIVRDGILPSTCGMMALTGSDIIEGLLYTRLVKYLCAIDQQVNMVSAVIAKDMNGIVSMEVTRLPSDLHILRADVYPGLYIYTPYRRYTLSDNWAGKTRHYILGDSVLFDDLRVKGPASAGTAFSRLASAILTSASPLAKNLGLVYLDEGFAPLRITTDRLLKWGGEVGASFIVQSLAYNAWAASQSTPLVVESARGKPATCYTLPFALGFLPLLIAALVIVVWSAFTLPSGGFASARMLEGLYGGMAPLRPSVCPEYAKAYTLMAWQKSPEPRLETVPAGHPITFASDPTAGGYLRSSEQEVIKAYQ